MDLIASLESHIAAFSASAEDAVKAKFAEFLAYVRGEEAKLKDAIAYVESKGLVVSRPAAVEPAAPSA